MKIDLWNLYEHMLRSRRFEGAVAQLWHQGYILGEMHLSIGEEAIAAGTVLQLQDGDAMALDHRGTAPLLMRGISADLLMKEMLGQADGLCAGKGGHMHLFSREHLSASSGIVGASGPAAAEILIQEGISVEVLDLRTVAPLDREAISRSVKKTGRLLVVDEDYMSYGLSGEIAACILEAGLSVSYARVCTEDTIPYNHTLEKETLPNTSRILTAIRDLFDH